MAGYDAERGYSGRDEPIGDRLRFARARLLTLALLLAVAGLAVFHPAAAAGRPLSSAADPTASEGLSGPFATNSGQHGLENRDPAPPAPERRAARGVDGLALQVNRPDQSLPARRTRLQRRMHAGPPSRAACGNSSRAPPRTGGATSPLA